MCPGPHQNVQVPSLRRRRTSPRIPRARRILCPGPLQNVQVPFPRCRPTSHLTPRAGRVQTSQKLQSFQAPFPGCPVTYTLSEVVAHIYQVRQNLNAAAHHRPPAGVPFQLPPLLLHQPPQDFDAALLRCAVQQVALVRRSLDLISQPLKTRQDLEGVADPAIPTKGVRRHKRLLTEEAVRRFLQVRLHLLPEDLRRVSEEPAGHRKGDQVVLLDALVDNLRPQLFRQLFEELVAVLGFQLRAHGGQLLRQRLSRLAHDFLARFLRLSHQFLRLCHRVRDPEYELVPPEHVRVLFVHLGALCRGFARRPVSHLRGRFNAGQALARLVVHSFAWSVRLVASRSLGGTKRSRARFLGSSVDRRSPRSQISGERERSKRSGLRARRGDGERRDRATWSARRREGGRAPTPSPPQSPGSRKAARGSREAKRQVSRGDRGAEAEDREARGRVPNSARERQRG